jgi:hypothetical protein
MARAEVLNVLRRRAVATTRSPRRSASFAIARPKPLEGPVISQVRIWISSVLVAPSRNPEACSPRRIGIQLMGSVRQDATAAWAVRLQRQMLRACGQAHARRSPQAA